CCHALLNDAIPCFAPAVGVIPQPWAPYRNHVRHTPTMGATPQPWATYPDYGRHTPTKGAIHQL
ncbi:unnamed protein product, partial [Allacma fusca]